MDPSTTTATPRPHPRRRGVLAVALVPLVAGLLGVVPAQAETTAPPSAAATERAGRDVAPLPDGLRPEGITSGRGTTYYAGGMADGKIVTGDLEQGGSRVLLTGAFGRQLRGMQWDARTDLIWAVGNVGTTAHVYAVNASTGRIRSDIIVPGGAFLNDVVVTDRSVWVTDSRVDRLTQIPLTAAGRPRSGADLRFLPLSGSWPAGDGMINNANGIRDLPNGDLVLNNSATGGLFQVSPTTGAATEIPVSGGPGLTGGDGLERRGLVLYDVRGSGPAEVSVLQLRRQGDVFRAVWLGALTAPSLDVPSTATYAGGALWAVNARFGVPSPETASYSISKLPARP